MGRCVSGRDPVPARMSDAIPQDRAEASSTIHMLADLIGERSWDELCREAMRGMDGDHDDDTGPVGYLIRAFARHRIVHSLSADGSEYREAYVEGFGQALHNTSLSPDAFYDEWVFAGCPTGKPRDPLSLDLRERIDAAALRMWSVHPNDLVRLGFVSDRHGGKYENPRTAYYAYEIGKIISSMDDDLTWFSKHTRLSLDHYSPMYCDDDDQTKEWRVSLESGSINDREWDIVGRGATAAEAIAVARRTIEEQKPR